MPTAADLGGRNPKRHLVLDEIDDEQFELGARDFLLLDRHDLADAVGRIDDEFVGLEALSLGSLLGGSFRELLLAPACGRALWPRGPRGGRLRRAKPAMSAGRFQRRVSWRAGLTPDEPFLDF